MLEIYSRYCISSFSSVGFSFDVDFLERKSRRMVARRNGRRRFVLLPSMGLGRGSFIHALHEVNDLNYVRKISIFSLFLFSVDDDARFIDRAYVYVPVTYISHLIDFIVRKIRE